MIILVGVLVAVYHAEVILGDDGVAEWLAAAHLHFQAHKQAQSEHSSSSRRSG